MYSTNEVVQMLVNNMNATMKMIDTKEYRIDYDKKEVTCWRLNKLWKDRLLNTYTFNHVINEAGGIVK